MFAVGIGIQRSVAAGVVGFVLFVILVGDVAPNKLGFGRVPNEIEGVEKRLEQGVAYQIRSSTKVGSGEILIIEEIQTSKLYALRVQKSPSEFFVLIGDKPVAIIPPVLPTGAK